MAIRFSSAPILMALAACGGKTLDRGSSAEDPTGAGASDGSGSSLGMAGGLLMPSGTAGSTSSGSGGGRPTGTGSGGTSTANPGKGACGDRGGGVDPGQPLTPWPVPTACEGGSTPLLGTWTGNYEGQEPSSGNTFSVQLAGEDAALCGAVTFFGPKKEFPPATNPNAGYPPDYEPSKFLDVVPGFTYTLLSASVKGDGAWFDISLAEPWIAWCELQTPYFDYDNGNGWHCARNLGTSYSGQDCHQIDECTGEEFMISCAQLELCNEVQPACACNSTGCQADLDGAPRHRFDLSFNGDDAKGALQGSAIFLHRD